MITAENPFTQPSAATEQAFNDALRANTLSGKLGGDALRQTAANQVRNGEFLNSLAGRELKSSQKAAERIFAESEITVPSLQDFLDAGLDSTELQDAMEILVNEQIEAKIVIAPAGIDIATWDSIFVNIHHRLYGDDGNATHVIARQNDIYEFWGSLDLPPNALTYAPYINTENSTIEWSVRLIPIRTIEGDDYSPEPELFSKADLLPTIGEYLSIQARLLLDAEEVIDNVKSLSNSMSWLQTNSEIVRLTSSEPETEWALQAHWSEGNGVVIGQATTVGEFANRATRRSPQ
ncbi:MAG: hypothetical protein WAQ27_04200 [Candidatus Microsaccharimonas sp.]